MKKKGSINIVEYIVYILFIIVSAFFISVMAFKYLNEDINTIRLETFILSKKLVSSDQCLAFKDEARIYQGTIDLEKLNIDNLKTCYTKENLGYTVKIKTLDGNIIKSAKNLNLRQEAYLPICAKVNDVKCNIRRDLILYKENENIKTGIIEIEVITGV